MFRQKDAKTIGARERAPFGCLCPGPERFGLRNSRFAQTVLATN